MAATHDNGLPYPRPSFDEPLSPQTRPAVLLIDSRESTQQETVKILRKQLIDLDVIGIATLEDVSWASAWNVQITVLRVDDRATTSIAALQDLAAVNRIFPWTSIIILSDQDDEATILGSLRRGADGSFSTEMSLDVALTAAKLILTGGVGSPQPLGSENDLRVGAQPAVVPLEGTVPVHAVVDMGMTPRESEVLAQLRYGRSNKEIARLLMLSEHTAKMHVRHIMRKLQVRSRTDAVLLSQRLHSDNMENQSEPAQHTPDSTDGRLTS